MTCVPAQCALWQPIETAPQDRTWVLVWEAEINQKYHPAEVARFVNNRWESSAMKYVNAVYWMPIPALTSTECWVSGEREALADELNGLFNAYLEQRNGIGKQAILDALWDNKAFIIAALRAPAQRAQRANLLIQQLAWYYRVNDCAERHEDDSIEVPVLDLKAADEIARDLGLPDGPALTSTDGCHK